MRQIYSKYDKDYMADLEKMCDKYRILENTSKN